MLELDQVQSKRVITITLPDWVDFEQADELVGWLCEAPEFLVDWKHDAFAEASIGTHMEMIDDKADQHVPAA